jgi:hypothetical protein
MVGPSFVVSIDGLRAIASDGVSKVRVYNAADVE